MDFFQTPLAKKLAARATPGECLRTYRENRGWTQEQMGKHLDVPKNYISDMEHGRRAISKEKAKILSRLFHISAEHFL